MWLSEWGYLYDMKASGAPLRNFTCSSDPHSSLSSLSAACKEGHIHQKSSSFFYYHIKMGRTRLFICALHNRQKQKCYPPPAGTLLPPLLPEASARHVPSGVSLPAGTASDPACVAGIVDPPACLPLSPLMQVWMTGALPPGLQAILQTHLHLPVWSPCKVHKKWVVYCVPATVQLTHATSRNSISQVHMYQVCTYSEILQNLDGSF